MTMPNGNLLGKGGYMNGGQEDLLPLDAFHPLRVERATSGKRHSIPAAPISLEREVWGLRLPVDLPLREPGSILRDLSASPTSCTLSPTFTPTMAPRKQSSPISVRSDASTSVGDEPAMVLLPGHTYTHDSQDFEHLTLPRPLQSSWDEDTDWKSVGRERLSSHDEEEHEDLASANKRIAMENAMLRAQCSQMLMTSMSIHLARQPPQPLNQQRHKASLLTSNPYSSELSSMPVGGNPNEGDADVESDTDASLELLADSSGVDAPTPTSLRVTVMLRNLPNNYSQGMLLELMDQLGFAGNYDFVYLPIDFKTQASLGYAFVNLTSPDDAKRFWKCFNGFSGWALPSQKVCRVNWSLPYQGLAAHIERYRNSPVMHEAVPDVFKPVLYQSGQRVPFPLPTKKIRAPRMRPGRSFLRSALAA